MHTMEETLSGWGNIPKSASKVLYPRDVANVRETLTLDKLLPRGLGRSYADQATNTGHLILKMEKMNGSRV